MAKERTAYQARYLRIIDGGLSGDEIADELTDYAQRVGDEVDEHYRQNPEAIVSLADRVMDEVSGESLFQNGHTAVIIEFKKPQAVSAGTEKSKGKKTNKWNLLRFLRRNNGNTPGQTKV